MIAFLLKTKNRLVIPAFFLSVIFSGCDSNDGRSANEIVFSGATMGTTYNIKVIDEGQDFSSDDLKPLVDKALQEINQSMSTYIESSELSLFNQSSVGVSSDVSEALCSLLDVNRLISDTTDGRYDMTIGPLVNLWGFGPEDRQGIPSDEAISQAKARVGYKSVEFDCEHLNIVKHKDVYVDLSASAKGYATDVLMMLLRNKGYARAMVEIGGELNVSGHNASGVAWRIAVERPEFGRAGAVQVLKVSDVAVATSGDYRNYYEVDGRRVSHTIDPITASPITHGLASVTVIAMTGAEADAWATALNVLGPEAGLELANQEHLAAYFIVRDDSAFRVEYTHAFKKYLVNL